MKVRIIGSNIDIGESLTKFVEDHLNKSVKKYFDTAINAEVHFTKQGFLFKSLIVINEGVKNGITVKGNSEAGDVYGSFMEALDKVSKQLSRYKRKIKNYRRVGGGLKSVEPNYKTISAVKYTLPPFENDASGETESDLVQEKEIFNVIAEKSADVEHLTVDEAIMKMDLADLPALVFINSKNHRLNVVYHRKDGNVAWIDPQL